MVGRLPVRWIERWRKRGGSLSAFKRIRPNAPHSLHAVPSTGRFPPTGADASLSDMAAARARERWYGPRASMIPPLFHGGEPIPPEGYFFASPLQCRSNRRRVNAPTSYPVAGRMRTNGPGTPRIDPHALHIGSPYHPFIHRGVQMKRITRSTTALFAALVAVALLSAGADSVQAQALPWNPPCANATIRNCTPFPVQLNFCTVPAGAIPVVVVPAFGVLVVPTPPPGLTIVGVRSCTGACIPLIQPAPAPCNCGLVPPPIAANAWVPSIALPPTCNCFDVFFNRNADPLYPCTIFICQVPGPPCRNP